MDESGSLNEEFRAAEALHRFETSMMLGQTAVFLVSTGTLFGAFASATKTTLGFTAMGIAMFGIFLSIAFIFITHRCGMNLRGARKRAEEIGADLGFKLYSHQYRASKDSLFAGINLTKGICAMGGLLWIFLIFGQILR